jgi:hypothetical protein
MGPRGMARRRGRRRGLIVGAAAGSAVARHNARNSEPEQYSPPEQVAEGTDEISELENLSRLKQQGIITEEEFTAKKKQILGI